jgi:hypothetical protein
MVGKAAAKNSADSILLFFIRYNVMMWVSKVSDDTIVGH